MKYRTDFVTNSSSSSFCITVKIEDKNGKVYSFDDDPFDYCEDFGEAYFDKDLSKILKEVEYESITAPIRFDQIVINNNYYSTEGIIDNVHIGERVQISLKEETRGAWGFNAFVFAVDVPEGCIGIVHGNEEFTPLVDAMKNKRCEVYGIVTQIIPEIERKVRSSKTLMSIRMMIKDDIKQNGDENCLVFNTVKQLCDFLTKAVKDDYSTHNYGKNIEVEKKKKEFTKEVTQNIKKISDIKTISVERSFWGIGEGCLCIATNDSKLRDLSREVIETLGDETKHKDALKNMMDYIKEPHPELGNYELGEGIADFRYVWNGNDSYDLVELAQNIIAYRSSSNDEGGYEYREVNVETGEYKEYARFGL